MASESALTYDPETGPDPGTWLASDEQLRIVAAEQAHTPLPKQHGAVGNLLQHAIFHVIVENQLLEKDFPATREALERLVSEGAERHEAVHALASVNAELMYQIMQGGSPEKANERLAEKLQALTLKSWKEKYADTPD